MRRGGSTGRSGRDHTGTRRSSYGRAGGRSIRPNVPDSRDQRVYNRASVDTSRAGARPPVSRSRSPLGAYNRRPISRSRSPLPQARPPRREPPTYGHQGERHLQSPFTSPHPPVVPKHWNNAPRGGAGFSNRPYVLRGAPHGVYVGNNYPFFMDQTPPEENPAATRTLFVGNIDPNLTPDDIKQIFDNFGIVEEVRLKDRQAEGGGPGRAFAFVRFFNLNQAYVAKMEMSGKYIGQNRCKIGYGRATATNCVWIGGLGAWISKQDLEREFDRFGRMIRVVWPGGHDYAYVVYDSVEAATKAVEEMRGFCFRGTSVRLRMDFSDEDQIDNPPPGLRVVRRPPFERRTSNTGSNNLSRDNNSREADGRGDNDERGSRSGSRSSYSRSGSASSTSKKGGGESTSPNGTTLATKTERSERKPTAPKKGRFRALEINLDKVNTVADITDCLPVVWTGHVVIKNQHFHTKLHRVTGRSDLVEDLLDSVGDESPSLKVTQRLRMDESKLEEVRKRITKAGSDGWSILVGVPEEEEATSNGASSLKRYPFVDLIRYLREKNAAGVLSLPPDCPPGQETGLLHIFPACEFVHRYLLERAPNFTMDYNDNEFVVMFLVSV